MKHRNPFVVILLSIVTLGIYDLYWLSTTRKTLQKETSLKIPSIWVLLAPVLVILVGVIMLIVGAVDTATTTPNYGYSYDPYTGAPVSNTQLSGTGTAGMIIMILGYIAIICVSFYWFWKYSKAVSIYTKGQMSFPVAFLLLWMLHLLGVAFIQDQFNHHDELAPVGGDTISAAPHTHEQAVPDHQHHHQDSPNPPTDTPHEPPTA